MKQAALEADEPTGVKYRQSCGETVKRPYATVISVAVPQGGDRVVGAKPCDQKSRQANKRLLDGDMFVGKG